MTITRYRAAEVLGVAAAIFLSAAAFTPASADPVNIIKLTSVVIATAASMTALMAAGIVHRSVALPRGPLPAAAAVLGFALIVAGFLTPSSTTAVFGTPGRLSGVLLYVCAIMLMVSTLRSGLAGLRAVDVGLIAAGAFTGLYGLLQYLGVDAVNWANEFNPIIAALGNPNFASAYMGICVPLLAAHALLPRVPGWRRATAGLLALGLLSVAVLSGASQGPLAAAAGMFVITVAVGLNLQGKRRQVSLGVASATFALGLVSLVLGSTGRGPASPLFGQGSFGTRQWYWDAALTMWREEPLVGVGIDSYGWFWRTARPVENVAALGGSDFTDAAHSVPLQLLATGGLLVALPYLAFVVIVLFHLVRGLLRLDAAPRLRLAGVGGAWVAYQVQSLVSIDQVPLVVLNFALAGAIAVAATAAPVWLLRFPGAAPLGVPQPRRGRAATAPYRRHLTAVDGTLLVLVGSLGLGVAWVAILPLRADVAVRTGDFHLQRGDGNASLAAYDKAIDLMPGRTLHWSRRGDLLAAVQQTDRALEAYDRALDADPSNIGVLKVVARVAEEEGELERARSYHARALERDPLNPATVAAAATFELRHGGAARALDVLEEAVSRIPAQATGPLWVPLGDARQVLGDLAGAMAAYEEAVRRDPAQSKASMELTKLRRGSASS